MSFRKFLPAVFVAVVAFFGVQGTAWAAVSSDAPPFDGKISAEDVLDMMVEVSGATTQRDITPKSALVDQRKFKITSASCAEGSDWMTYYMGPAKVGSGVKGVVGGTLCNGDKRFHVDRKYLPETYHVWKLMAQVSDEALGHTNQKLFGLYFGSAVGKRIYSNGKVARLVFDRLDWQKKRSAHTLKMVKIIGSKVKVTRF